MNIYLQQVTSLSLSNKYTKWYCSIITYAINRNILSGMVKHHILPRSFKLGGNKDIVNYAYLTPKEHFVCHHLLSKMLVNQQLRKKMNSACYLMSHKHIANNEYRVTARVFASFYSDGPWNKGLMLPPQRLETRQKRSIALKGRTWPERRGIPSWNKGLTLSDEKYKVSGRKNKGKTRIFTEEHKKNIGLSQIGKTMSEETKEKLRVPKSESHKQSMSDALISRGTVTCPHCSKEGASMIMNRWHFDNCKHKTC